MQSHIKQFLRHTYRGCQGILHTLTDRPSVAHEKCTKLVIGKSHEDRKIVCYQIGSGERHIVFVSGIHGNEVGTVTLAHHVLQWLEDVHTQYPDLRFSVLPCLNPDGYAQAKKHPQFFSGGRKGRFNAKSIDLNRNFPTPSFHSTAQWNHGKNYLETTSVQCGSHGGSEPETQAMTSYILEENVSLLFTFHSVGSDVMPSDHPDASKLGQIYSQACGYRYLDSGHWRTLNQTGTSVEWCEEHDVPCIEVEGRYRWGSDWESMKKSMERCLANLTPDPSPAMPS